MFTYILNPQPICHETICHEIAKALNIAVDNILRFEYWQHQLWAHIEGIGGRILSYRSLPAYLQQAFLAIKNCQTLDQLWELGQLFKLETERFSQYYENDYAKEYLNQLREAWAEKRDDLREEEKRLAPIRKHQQDGQEWLEMWQKMISHCQSVHSLQYLYPEMERQSQEFADLPKIIEELLQTFQQQWRELNNER